MVYKVSIVDMNRGNKYHFYIVLWNNESDFILTFMFYSGRVIDEINALW